MSHNLIDPNDPPHRQQEKLLKIIEALMLRVERSTDESGAALAQFERAVMLETLVQERTSDLANALKLLNAANDQLAQAMQETDAARRNLTEAIEAVQDGFALFNAGDELVMYNTKFGAQIHDISDKIGNGIRFESYLRLIALSGHVVWDAGEDAADWIALRIAQHKRPGASFTIRLQEDQWLQVSEHPTRDGGTVVLQTDITDIIHRERQERGKLLDEQAQVIRATLDHINQGVLVFGNDARLIVWNAQAARLLGISPAALVLGLAFDDLVPSLLAPTRSSPPSGVERLILWGRKTGPRASLRAEIRPSSGLILDAFAQDLSGGGFVVSARDVTPERRAIEALSRANETLEARVTMRTRELQKALADAERANAARSRFVAAASHDLLQPLSAAKLFVASIGDDPLPPRASEAMAKAGAALESVEIILGALLDISRLESGHAAVRVGPVPLRPLLERLADEFAETARHKGLRLVIRASDLAVLSDATYLRRILQNLIGNALRYTQTGGVLVGVRPAGAGRLRVEVLDTGPGIPAEEHGNIFREFHRLNARASASEGLGLGLAIVDRAARLLDHPLRLRSVVGRGTWFSLDLPIAEARIAAQVAPQPKPVKLLGLIGCVIEPDAALRAAIVHLLEGRGVDVLEAEDRDGALALVEELGILPDFILLDAPGEADAAVVSVMVLTSRLGPIPAMILSADRSQPFRTTCRMAGAGVLLKPVDAGALDYFLSGLRGG